MDPPLSPQPHAHPDPACAATPPLSRFPLPRRLSLERLPQARTLATSIEVTGAGYTEANGRYDLKGLRTSPRASPRNEVARRFAPSAGRPCYAMKSGAHEYQLRTAHPHNRWAIVRRQCSDLGKYRVVYSVYTVGMDHIPVSGWHVREGEFASGCDIGVSPFPSVRAPISSPLPQQTTGQLQQSFNQSSPTTGREPSTGRTLGISSRETGVPTELEVIGAGFGDSNGRYQRTDASSKVPRYEMRSGDALYQFVYLPITWWVIARHAIDGPPLETKFLGYARPFKIVYAAKEQGLEAPETGWHARKTGSMSGADIGTEPNPCVRPAHTARPSTTRSFRTTTTPYDPLSTGRHAGTDSAFDASDAPLLRKECDGERECPLCFERIIRVPKVLIPCGHVVCPECSVLPPVTAGQPCPLCKVPIQAQVRIIYDD